VYRRSDGGKVAMNRQEYAFFYGEGSEDHQLGTGFFIYKTIISAVRRVEFIRDRVL
jgi:hypothetical protein